MSLNGIKEKDLKEEAFRLCQEFLGIPWSNADLSDFRITVVSGGLSNKLYRCSLSNNVVIDNPKVPREVLLRIFGILQDEEHKKAVEAATFVLLAEQQLGPKLYGIFPAGRLEEYIPSRTLKQKDMKSKSSEVATMLAKIHTLNVPLRKTPDLWENLLKRWIQDLEKVSLEILNEKFSLTDFYKEEIKWLKSEFEKTESPIVYCHNDLLGGNILIREDSTNHRDSNILFIDFEFGGYNYRAFDIANHFSEWIYEYNTPDPPYFELDQSKYPTKQERLKFIQSYVEQLAAQGSLKDQDVGFEANKILKELKPFGIASHLLWSLWCQKMKFKSDFGKFYEEYGKTRLELYKNLKEKYLRKQINTEP